MALAYSGGLDTSFCVAYYTREIGAEVHAAFCDTGGFSRDDIKELEQRALAFGAKSFIALDGKQAVVDQVVRHLIAGNVRRGATYPMCVAAERAIQAKLVIEHALKIGADAIAQGSTGAGNDQIRFEVAIRALAPDIVPLAPVRDLGLTREDEVTKLESWKLADKLPKNAKKEYSINRGLWGATIGGKETTTSDKPLPDHAYVLTTSPAKAPDSPQTVRLTFDAGIPVAIDGKKLGAVELIEKLEKMAGAHGVGRGMHLGDTIIGIKGRVAYEAPAAEVLLIAHRELEKLVLTRQQQRTKDSLAAAYGDMVHEGQFFDPAARNIEAFFDATQKVVSGDVDVELFKGVARVLGVSSPYSMMAASGARYGEKIAGYTPRDAAGFVAILGNSARITAVARKGGTK
ncbi:MAG: argininosuccinate synthase [Planctomycetaceae bacterium]|nr:argininosuccinate synthase [Planctomycetaceae bacterium]